MTSELRAEPGRTSDLRADPGQSWLLDERAPAVQPGRHRRAPEARSSYCEVFVIGEFRALWSAQVPSFAGDQFAQSPSPR